MVEFQRSGKIYLTCPYNTFFWKNSYPNLPLVANITNFYHPQMKGITSMKKTLFFVSLLAMYSSAAMAELPVIFQQQDPGSRPRVRSMSLARVMIPVSAGIDDASLNIQFNNTIGTAFITVVKHTGELVYSENVEATASLYLNIDASDWESGNYELYIQYAGTTLTGNFKVQ